MDTTEKNSSIAEIIRERRSVKKGYTNKEVKKELVLDLLNDAIYAPTHGNRQPWRFIFVGQDQLPYFAEKVSRTYPEESQENRRQYLMEPNAILVVIMEAPPLPKQWDENFGAVSSMIQNLWLLAWEKQLGMVWKTNPHIYNEKVKELLDVQEHEKIVGFIHLGYFDEIPADKGRVSAEEKFTVYKG